MENLYTTKIRSVMALEDSSGFPATGANAQQEQRSGISLQITSFRL